MNLGGQQTREQLPPLLAEYAQYFRPLSQEGDIWLFEIVGWPC